MTSILEIVPAGAGSGKTYKIKSDLMELLRNEKVKPHRIMAVTFTEAAAGELKDRIRSALLADGMVNEAIEVERAYVSTIHGLGLRILTEHAFAAGSSPRPRHLSDAERDLLIRQELSHCEALDPIKADLQRYGYIGNSWAGGTAEDAFRSTVFRSIDLLRGLGDGGADPELADEAVATLRAGYGEVVSDPAPLRTRLQVAAATLLDEFQDGGIPFAGDSNAAQTDFRDQLRALRAARDGRDLDRDWKLWTSLSELRTKARGMAIPERFKAASEEVIAAAGEIARHPGPLDDACANLRSLIAGAQAIMAGYSEKKRKAGVIDFSDMVVEAERLLRTKPAILEAIIADIDCVIVDEFQDTNPVQFALLWRIAQAAPRTLLVGDTKQSIMGFQGADPRLTEALVSQFSENAKPLAHNWRSDPRLMHFVNELSGHMFGKGYDRLEPKRPETGKTFLEFVRIPQGRRSRAPNARPEQHIAARVKAILDEGTIIADRHGALDNPDMRPARPGDVAILCQTHAQAARYADRLQELGVPVRINRQGWLASPPVVAALNALAFIADPTDTHAALCLLTLGPRAMTLQDAMTALSEGVLLAANELAPLVKLAESVRATPLSALVSQVIAQAGLRDWADSLPDAVQMRADLLKLESEVVEFERAHRDMKAAAGFYGQSAHVFLGWLRSRVDERDFNRHPDPGSGFVEGVEIVTWHASKGREWNIVFVVGFDTPIGEKPGTMRAEFADFTDLDNVLSKAVLRFTPALPMKEKRDIFIELRRSSAEADARRLLYVALTRARDRLVLEWPDFKLKKLSDGPGPANYAEVLVRECGLELQAGQARVGEYTYPARLLQCTDEPSAEFDVQAVATREPMIGFGEHRSAPALKKTPWRTRPSQLTIPGGRAIGTVHHVDLGAPVVAESDAFDQADLRGTAWHLAFRTAVVRPELLTEARLAIRIDADVVNAIAAQAKALTTWLSGMGYDRFHCELPLQLEECSGAQTNATIDLLAEGPNGLLIVDHKSGTPADLVAGFASYRPQLAAYAELVAKLIPGKPARGMAINWMRAGKIVWEKL